ncbi:MAG TPA: DUF4291 domain-containing protein [Myxococcota bacterium]
MKIELESYAAQSARWPKGGAQILACYDDDGVVVYQAYRPSIASFAVAHQHFGGADFSFSRMSWVKPGFLWMMYRSSWGTADGQERVLALTIKRAVFDGWLAQAVASTFGHSASESREEWQRAVTESNVRLQWDPDHGPSGVPLARRALQIGLRGPALAPFAGEAFLAIDDVSALAAEQRGKRGDAAALATPVERVYPVSEATRARLGIVTP